MKFKWMICMLALLVLAGPMMAQEGAAPAANPVVNWVAIGFGISMALASGICALAQGKATASAVESMARNPGASAGIRGALILGLALIESLALYTLVVIFYQLLV
ncbi:MAG: ATP synthase F0 subunit C [Gammaproteobacteria bacterium]